MMTANTRPAPWSRRRCKLKSGLFAGAETARRAGRTRQPCEALLVDAATDRCINLYLTPIYAVPLGFEPKSGYRDFLRSQVM